MKIDSKVKALSNIKMDQNILAISKMENNMAKANCRSTLMANFY